MKKYVCKLYTEKFWYDFVCCWTASETITAIGDVNDSKVSHVHTQHTRAAVSKWHSLIPYYTTNIYASEPLFFIYFV